MCNVSLNGTQPSDASLRVLRAFEAAGLEAWYVGGWVRDALMGYPSHDVDMCCSGLWQESKAALEAAGIAVVESGIKFGGITAISDGERIEVTTYRLDGFYTDGRHPQSVERAASLEDDLARRDFTVNAMAWHPERGLVDRYDGQGDLERKLIRAMNDKRLDALCIASVDSEADTINDVIRSGMPIVLVDRVLNDVNTSQVCWNDEQSAEQLTKLLLANNHRRIAVVNVTLSHSVGRNRLAGFKKAMQEAQISLPKSYISPSNFSAEDAYRYVLRVMKQKSRPTALLCCNNVMAEGALRAIGELGLKIYDDVSLVAFGSQDWNKYLMPKITSIEMDSCDMGERAGSIMVDMINSGPKIAAKMILSGRLMEGGSVKKLSLET